MGLGGLLEVSVGRLGVHCVYGLAAANISGQKKKKKMAIINPRFLVLSFDRLGLSLVLGN